MVMEFDSFLRTLYTVGCLGVAGLAARSEMVQMSVEAELPIRFRFLSVTGNVQVPFSVF